MHKMELDIDLSGRSFLITGAARGLGASYGDMLCSRGAHVMINDIDAAAAQEKAGDLRERGYTALSNCSDITTWDGAQEAVARTDEAFGRLDGLICNAGFLRDRSFHKMTRDEMDSILRVHLMGAIYPTHAAWPIMRDAGFGRVVLTASTSSLWGNFGQANYDAAKGGLCGFMGALKLEGKKYNVQINTIAPLAATRLSTDLFKTQEFPDMPPEQIAGLVSYLCSPACELNGEILEAGGGYVSRATMMRSGGVVADLSRPENVGSAIRELLTQTPAQSFLDAHQSITDILRRLLVPAEKKK